MVILCNARQLAFRIISWLILLVLLFYSPANRLTSTQLEVSLLDVGQGLAMVVRDAEHVLVYDTGPRYGTGFSAAEAVLLPFLRARGVGHIDTLIISHADNDHIGGLQIVRDAFSIDQILSSRPDKVSDAELCEQGQAWEWRATQFEMLSPNSDTPPGSNNLSCVLKIRHAATTLLITGDIEKQVERYLIEQQLPLTADVMLVPHQGSKTSSTSAFLDAVGPSLALLAAGYKNHYGHPHEEVMQRYRQRQIAVESTIEQGTVVLTVGQTGVEITRYRQHAGRFWHR